MPSLLAPVETRVRFRNANEKQRADMMMGFLERLLLAKELREQVFLAGVD
jgi:hypothetical protein